MQNAKVNQRSKQYPVRPEGSENRNWFEGLSHDWKASFTMGKLVPFLMLFTLPNDYFKIRAEVMMRFAPLYLPIMHRVNLALDYFFVPSRIIFNMVPTVHEGWEDFIMGKGGLNPFINYTAIDYTYGSASEVPMYMGVPTVIEAEIPSTYVIQINALPLAAYYMIYDQYYRNDQIQAPINAQLGIADGATGASLFTIEPAASLSCAYRNWNRDLYTMCTPEPQEGAPVQIPLVEDDFESPSGLGYKGPFRWRNRDDDTPHGILENLRTAGTPAGDEGQTIGFGGESVYLDIQETAATIAQFRFAAVYQEYLERAMRTGDKYSDWTENFWNTDPYKGTLQLPQFLGAQKGKVVVSEVMSTAETETLKVGSYAGQALALESVSNAMEYHCLEHGWIIGIVSVYPDSGYFQGLERIWSVSTHLDYPDPRFALIGDEEVQYKEVQYAYQDALLARNDQSFGYREKYAWARFKNDVVAGLFRTVLNSFHLGRLFNPLDPENLTTGSVLNSQFLQCKPRITDVFQVVEGEDEIYCHIYNDVKVQRMLPKFGIPTL